MVIERPEYGLTIFKIHFRKQTLKIYTKGERVLRIEAVESQYERPGLRQSAGKISADRVSLWR